MQDLEGKVAFVTGGSGGLGTAIATALARQGAAVAVADLPSRTSQVAALVGQLQTSGQAEAAGVELDVRAPASIRAAVEDTVARLGGLDIGVCNAGLNVRKPSLEVTEEDWDTVLDVNLRGVFFSAQSVAAKLVEQGRGGKIVLIASIMGLVGSPFGHAAAYCASKAGVVNLARTLAVEWANYRINVNAVAPTYAPTPLTEGLFNDQSRLQAVLDRTPMASLASPESIADAVAFLASPRADMITGVTLPVDCGWTAW
ncbi:MAG: SDR family oxidoreductase [Chloroflexi bacterium]|nr:SDR family oxidoreductase [Chloroflexota bacterium]MBV9602343.1 SDR family oxidoreductase [Chloroflexota bacterium]